MIKYKICYIIVLIIIILHHCKGFIKELLVDEFCKSNYKHKILILHGIFPILKDVDKEYDKLIIKNIEIFRMYNPLMLIAMGMPVIIPFIRLL